MAVEENPYALFTSLLHASEKFLAAVCGQQHLGDWVARK